MSTFVVRQLKNVAAEEREMWLIKITDQLTTLNLQDPHVTLELIKKVIQECLRPEDALKNTESIFNVINMFDIPKVMYDIEKKKFILRQEPSDLYAEAIDKPNAFINRVDLIKRIILRQEKFSARKFGDEDVEKYELTEIEFLNSNSKIGEVYVLGIVSQITEGQYYLEDHSGTVKIDLKKAISFFNFM